MGAAAVVGAVACIVALLMVASGASFWTAIGIPVIILAALILVLMHVFASVARSPLASLAVGFGYLAVGVAILRWAAAKAIDLFPGPGILAVVAFVGGALAVIGATRTLLRARSPGP